MMPGKLSRSSRLTLRKKTLVYQENAGERQKKKTKAEFVGPSKIGTAAISIGKILPMHISRKFPF